MEGPTPVSALIHAATMVTAGVYLIARSMPLLTLAPGVLHLIAVTGCATALLSASIAVTQTDLKRVLAYSTVSQLGYMFMALGAGVGSVAQLAVVAAMFHLFTHAFFKALLFLAAGSVMHAMGDVIDMRRFGGLRHRLPFTCWTFAVGGLALSAIFPLSGFFSKDEILLSLKSSWHRRDAGPGLALGVFPDLLGRGFHGVPDGVLHGPSVLHDVLGPREAAQPRRPRGTQPATPVAATDPGHGDPGISRRSCPRPCRRPRCHGTISRRPRIAANHDLSADRAGGLHGLDRFDLSDRGPVRGHDRVVCPPPARHVRVRVAGTR